MKKPFYKRWWFIVLAVIVVLAIIGSLGGNKDTANKSDSNDHVKVATDNQQESETATEDASKNANEETKAEPEEAKEEDVPREYKAALNKAKTYVETMYLSKAGVYDQLTSEYGENFPEDAAKYAIENLDIDWKKVALKKAQSYAKTMDVSNDAIYEQLVSEYGEKFTEEEARYAIENLK